MTAKEINHDLGEMVRLAKRARLRKEDEERKARWAKMPPVKRFFYKLGYYTFQVVSVIISWVIFAIIGGVIAFVITVVFIFITNLIKAFLNGGNL